MLAAQLQAPEVSRPPRGKSHVDWCVRVIPAACRCTAGSLGLLGPLVSPEFSEENIKWRTIEEDTQHQPLASTCTRAAHCTHANFYTHMSLYAFIRKT